MKKKNATMRTRATNNRYKPRPIHDSQDDGNDGDHDDDEESQAQEEPPSLIDKKFLRSKGASKMEKYEYLRNLCEAEKEKDPDNPLLDEVSAFLVGNGADSGLRQ